MIHLVTGFTGAVVPVIVEQLFRKDPQGEFWFALRRDRAGTSAGARVRGVLATLALSEQERAVLSARSRAIEIEVRPGGLAMSDADRDDVLARVDTILHGAADVRFDQPYEEMHCANVVFTREMHALHRAIAKRRPAGNAPPVFYCLSTAYAYGAHAAPVPDEYPAFSPGEPENTYVRTKAEARRFLLDEIRDHGDRIVIFEPTIVGGAAADGRTRAYHLHYLLLMLGYLGRLPFLTARENTLDIVPVDWVADVISEVIVRNELQQGLVRLAAGRDAVTIGELHDAGYAWYTANDPVPGHRIPRIRFVPAWFLRAAAVCARHGYGAIGAFRRDTRYQRRAREIALLEGYLPYVTVRRTFENERSAGLIRRYTGRGPAPVLPDRYGADGRLSTRGYYDRILADTIRTGWGGQVDFRRLLSSSRA